MTTLADLLDPTNHSASQRRATELARNDLQFKQDLIARRVAAGLSQEDLARKLGLSQPTISDFERPDSDPKLSTVRRYAHAVEALVEHYVRPDTGELSSGAGWKTVTFRVQVPIRTNGTAASYAVAQSTVDFALAA